MSSYVAHPRAGYTESMIVVQATPSTVQSLTTHGPLTQATSRTWPVWIEDSWEDDEAEEQEWESIISKPHVREALRRMAMEARQQYYAGETEEGGFAIE